MSGVLREAGVLKEANAAGVGELLPLMRAYAAFDGLSFDEGTARRTLTQLLADRRLGRVWFIVSEGAVCGYVALCFGFSIELGGRDAFVDELFIEPAYRNRGLGTQALQQAGDAVRADGVVALHLEVRRDNAEAQRYYERLDFRKRDRYFFMTRRLAAIS
jgi:ribosomal protein S18 acetylase RimI-like enzyme